MNLRIICLFLIKDLECLSFLLHSCYILSFGRKDDIHHVQWELRNHLKKCTFNKYEIFILLWKYLLGTTYNEVLMLSSSVEQLFEEMQSRASKWSNYCVKYPGSFRIIYTGIFYTNRDRTNWIWTKLVKSKVTIFQIRTNSR